MAKKRTTININEDFMKDIIAQGVPISKRMKDEMPVPETFNSSIESNMKEYTSTEKVIEVTRARESKRKRENDVLYVDEYFKIVDFTDRQMVNITRETHSKLIQIVNTIGGKKATIAGYIENILRKHFEIYRDEINELCQQKPIKPL